MPGLLRWNGTKREDILSEATDTIHLQCGHLIHKKCLVEMLAAGVAAGRRCPTCQTPIVTEMDVRICVPEDHVPATGPFSFPHQQMDGRGLHSFTLELNLSNSRRHS